MVKHSATLCVLIATGVASGDVSRDRKARVALALASTMEGLAVAPAPRAVALPGYAGAYQIAVDRSEPLVVYIGCDGWHPVERLPNAVVGTAAELTGYEPGTVVIGYPHGGRVFVHVTLRCPDHGEPVVKAVEEARKKLAAPPGKSQAAPVPLHWEVRASR